MDERIKEKLINRAKTNPYVNFLGIDFTVIEEGRVEAHMPLHDEQRQYSGVTHGGCLGCFGGYDRRFRRLYDDPAGERRADGRVENVFLTGRLGQ